MAGVARHYGGGDGGESGDDGDGASQVLLQLPLHDRLRSGYLAACHESFATVVDGISGAVLEIDDQLVTIRFSDRLGKGATPTGARPPTSSNHSGSKDTGADGDGDGDGGGGGTKVIQNIHELCVWIQRSAFKQDGQSHHSCTHTPC